MQGTGVRACHPQHPCLATDEATTTQRKETKVIVGRPTQKPSQPRVPIWVTEKELSLIVAKFQGFRGGLAEAISAACVEAKRQRTAHNQALRVYRNSRKASHE
jgi:hypothetical protein